MKSAMLEMFKSKKFLAALLGLLAIVLQAAASGLGFAVSEETLLYVLGLLATYILGQGVADLGKAKTVAALSEPKKK